jgi:hypothetical protein
LAEVVFALFTAGQLHLGRTVNWNEGGSRQRKVSGQREDLGVSMSETAKTTAPTDSAKRAKSLSLNIATAALLEILMVARYSTLGARPSLTLEIERDPVFSRRYGRS